MEIILGGKGQGKTLALIKESAENNVPIIVNTYSDKVHVESKANELNLQIPEPIVFEEVKNGRIKVDGVSKVYVDDADTVLSNFIGAEVVIATITQN